MQSVIGKNSKSTAIGFINFNQISTIFCINIGHLFIFILLLSICMYGMWYVDQVHNANIRFAFGISDLCVLLLALAQSAAA